MFASPQFKRKLRTKKKKQATLQPLARKCCAMSQGLVCVILRVPTKVTANKHDHATALVHRVAFDRAT